MSDETYVAVTYRLKDPVVWVRDGSNLFFSATIKKPPEWGNSLPVASPTIALRLHAAAKDTPLTLAVVQLIVDAMHRAQEIALEMTFAAASYARQNMAVAQEEAASSGIPEGES